MQKRDIIMICDIIIKKNLNLLELVISQEDLTARVAKKARIAKKAGIAARIAKKAGIEARIANKAGIEARIAKKARIINVKKKSE